MEDDHGGQPPNNGELQTLQNAEINNSTLPTEVKERRLKHVAQKLIRIGAIALLSLAGTYGVIKTTAPYDETLGKRDISQTAAGDSLLALSAWAESTLPDNSEVLTTQQKIVQEATHIMPRLLVGENPVYYAQYYKNKLFSKPFNENNLFSEEFKREDLEVPNWVQDTEAIFGKYTDSRGQVVDTVTIDMAGVEPQLLKPWEIFSTTIAPNINLAWPDGKTRTPNTFTLGADPNEAHSNGIGYELKTRSGTRIIGGLGWMNKSPFYNYNEATGGKEVKQSYGLTRPNNDAMLASGLYEIKDHKFVVQQESAGNLDNSDTWLQYLNFQNGRIDVLSTSQVKTIIDGKDNKLPNNDAFIAQIAYAIPFSDAMIIDVNSYSQPDKNRLIDDLQLQIKEWDLHDYATTWMVLLNTDTNRQIVSYVVNPLLESLDTKASFKVAAGIDNALSSHLVKPGEKIINGYVIHTGQQGSTANVIFAKPYDYDTDQSDKVDLQTFLEKKATKK